jgi:tRNA(Met) C34 N-acetyltransferase TmcA
VRVFNGQLEGPLTSREDFRRRFLTLLSYKFREFGSVTALSILEAANAGIKEDLGEIGMSFFCWHPLNQHIL